MTEFGLLFHTSVPEILETLMDQPMCAMDIEKRTGLDNSGLQKTLKILQNKGYTDKYQGEQIRHLPKMKMIWFLTPKGRSAAKAIIECRDALEGIA